MESTAIEIPVHEPVCHHNSDNDGPGIETRPQWQQADDKPPDPWHCPKTDGEFMISYPVKNLFLLTR